MIFGEFLPPGQARVLATIRNAEGEEAEINAIVDTGFMGSLLLPRTLANDLNLPQIDQEVLALAEGSLIRFAVHEVVIDWQDEERIVAAHVADGDILIGIELLRGNVGTIQFFDGGEVIIETAD